MDRGWTSGKKKDFIKELDQRVLLADGSISSLLFRYGLPIKHHIELANIEQPELVSKVHMSYIDAGADLIKTNTFGAGRTRLARYQLQDKTWEINCKGAQIASECARRSNVFVAGSIGPLSDRKIKTPPEEALAAYKEQISALAEGGADVLLMETFTGIEDLLTAIRAARESANLPLICSMSFLPVGKTNEGLELASMCKVLEKEKVDILGINHGSGPLDTAHLAAELSKIKKPGTKVCIMPGLGGPKSFSERNIYLYDIEYFNLGIRRALAAGANIIGGCCGVTVEYIRGISTILKGGNPNYNPNYNLNYNPNTSSLQICSNCNEKDKTKEAQDYLKVSVDREETLIRTREILYIQSEHREVTIHTASHAFHINENLTQLMKRLPPYVFQRVHKSYSVNRDRIEYIRKHSRTLYEIHFTGGGEKTALATKQGVDLLNKSN